MTASSPFRIFGTVGTDHHQFDRLIDWLDGWLEETSEVGPVQAVVQAGASKSPRRAECAGVLPFDEFQSALAEADAVVCHGGSSTIAQAQLAGHRPLVIPRRPELGEHVDDHQVRYAARLAEHGEIVLIDSYDAFAAALDRGLATGPTRPRALAAAVEAPAVERFRALVEPLLCGNEDR
jgi:UDP-N-acetylglucosamine transferase subunit ALG13